MRTMFQWERNTPSHTLIFAILISVVYSAGVGVVVHKFTEFSAGDFLLGALTGALAFLGSMGICRFLATGMDLSTP